MLRRNVSAPAHKEIRRMVGVQIGIHCQQPSVIEHFPHLRADIAQEGKFLLVQRSKAVFHAPGVDVRIVLLVGLGQIPRVLAKQLDAPGFPARGGRFQRRLDFRDSGAVGRGLHHISAGFIVRPQQAQQRLRDAGNRQHDAGEQQQAGCGCGCGEKYFSPAVCAAARDPLPVPTPGAAGRDGPALQLLLQAAGKGLVQRRRVHIAQQPVKLLGAAVPKLFRERIRHCVFLLRPVARRAF